MASKENQDPQSELVSRKKRVVRVSSQSVSLKKSLKDTSTPVGRTEEISAIRRFISTAFDSGSDESACRALYVSGPPGSGKSLSVSSICRTLSEAVLVNCMEVSSSAKMFSSRIAEELGVTVKGRVNTMGLRAAEHAIERFSKPLLLILDEIDQISAQNLRRVFSWPYILRKQDFVLIGIANSLNLCDQVFTTAMAPKIQRLSFAPYDKSQLSDIVFNRLTSASVDVSAMRLVAGRVAASTVDIRQAIDVCRRSIDMADGAPSLSHVSRALQVSQAPNSVRSSLSSQVPLQQKLVIAAALKLRRQGKRSVTLSSLQDSYREICKLRDVLSMDDFGEFSSVCSLLEARGILKVLRSTRLEMRQYKVSLRPDDQEVEDLIDDQIIVSTARL